MELPARLFISYAHADENHRRRLDVHLATMTHERLISTWHDRMIPPGSKWADEIDKNLANADVVLLLVSADFIASRYCVEREVKLALKRHRQGKTHVVPVFVEPADVGGLPFAKLQGLPRNARPVSLWSNNGEAWCDVVTALRGLLTNGDAKPPAKARGKAPLTALRRPRKGRGDTAPTPAPPRAKSRVTGSRLVEISIRMDFDKFGLRDETLIQHALANFLKIAVADVRVVSKRRGSVKLVVELPMESAVLLVHAFRTRAPELTEQLAAYSVTEIGFGSEREAPALTPPPGRPTPVRQSYFGVRGAAERVSAAVALMRSELERFADRYELTAREYDVVFLLLSGLSTVALIAERLGLSQSTIHNHFKNVFRRTGANSKAGLLALFLKDAIGHQASLQPFIKRPSILLLEPDARVRANIREALQARHMRVEEEPDSRNVLDRIAELRTDVVIADLALPGQSGAGVLADVSARYGQNPLVLLTTSDSSVSRRAWVERGAGGLFVKPVAIDRLAFAILEHFVETPYERSRLLRVEVDVPARIDDRLEVELGNIGFGGAFIPLPIECLSRDGFLVGQRIQMTFSLEDSASIEVLCEIMWRRSTSRPSMQSGIGVRFLNLEESQRSSVEEFVRRRKLMGFLPWAGPERDESVPAARARPEAG